MLFSSIGFIYYFLPVMLIVYYVTPRKFKNLMLLLGSLFFYFLGEPKYTLLLVFSTAVDFSHSQYIAKHRGSIKAKRALISSITINLLMLITFKYADFLVSNFNTVLNTDLPLPNLSLPIGISFFTFQTMSYTIDVYRNEVEVQKSITTLGTYVALFPQLIAGPIVRYKTIEKALNDRVHSYENFAYGVSRFIIGLAKKVIIANSLGELAEMIYHTGDISVIYYWMTAIAYAFQIYYDFSGYSDMAIGLGRMFGFHFLENFNYPYTAKSITEFWRRWHMSLGQWFRDYVYIPLGGNKVSGLKWFRNITIVWFLTGLWHGASWNFILWGLFFMLILLLEKVALLKYLNKAMFLNHLYVMVIVVLSFVVFRNESLNESVIHFKSMFMLKNIPFNSEESFYYLKSYGMTLIVATIGATPLLKKGIEILKSHDYSKRLFKYSEPLIYIVLLLITTGYLVDSSFNPFLYYRF